MYFIELLTRLPEERAILIKGWAFRETDKEPAEITVKADREVEKVLKKSVYREDVLGSYDLDYGKGTTRWRVKSAPIHEITVLS